MTQNEPDTRSATALVLDELQLFGHRPFADEPDPRPLPDAGTVEGAIADIFDAMVVALGDIWAALDKVRAKHDDMVLLHGGSPKGAERIAACWAANRKCPQIVFKPDWMRHGKAAPFKRNDQLLETLPISNHSSGIDAFLTRSRQREIGRVVAAKEHGLPSPVQAVVQPERNPAGRCNMDIHPVPVADFVGFFLWFEVLEGNIGEHGGSFREYRQLSAVPPPPHFSNFVRKISQKNYRQLG